MLGVVFYAAVVGLLTGAVQRLGKSRPAGLVAATCLFFLPLLVSSQHGIHAGYADFPLAALCLAAASRLPGWRGNIAASDRRLFAVFAMLMVWTKTDGVVLLAAMLCATWLALGWRRLPRAVAGRAIGGAAVFFNGYLHLMNAPRDHYASPTPANILAHIDRAGPAFLAMMGQAFDWTQWSLLWPGAVLALVTLAWRGQRRCALLLLVLMGLPVVGYTFVYVLSTWPGPLVSGACPDFRVAVVHRLLPRCAARNRPGPGRLRHDAPPSAGAGEGEMSPRPCDWFLPERIRHQTPERY